MVCLLNWEKNDIGWNKVGTIVMGSCGISLWLFCLFLTNKLNCFPRICDMNFLQDIVWNKWFIKWTPSSSTSCLQSTCLFWQIYILFLFVLPHIRMYAYRMPGYTSDTLLGYVLIFNSLDSTKNSSYIYIYTHTLHFLPVIFIFSLILFCIN